MRFRHSSQIKWKFKMKQHMTGRPKVGNGNDVIRETWLQMQTRARRPADPLTFLTIITPELRERWADLPFSPFHWLQRHTFECKL